MSADDPREMAPSPRGNWSTLPPHQTKRRTIACYKSTAHRYNVMQRCSTFRFHLNAHPRLLSKGGSRWRGEEGTRNNLQGLVIVLFSTSHLTNHSHRTTNSVSSTQHSSSRSSLQSVKTSDPFKIKALSKIWTCLSKLSTRNPPALSP
jgi:hypothetical protein